MAILKGNTTSFISYSNSYENDDYDEEENNYYDEVLSKLPEKQNVI
ncbi:MAG: hypothetical protein IJ094_12785 [Bacilli bacterium]|nr:hypothetical protein [Bacilli bacterium]